MEEKPKSKIISINDTHDMENTPLSIEQAGNYIRHKDFHKTSMAKIQALKEKTLSPYEASKSAQNRALRLGLACLPNKDKGLVYRKLLACRVQGATYEDLSLSMKISVVKVKELEKEAMDTIKTILSSRRIMPVVQ